MGLFSSIGDTIGGVVDSVTGRDARKAGKRQAESAAQATEEQRRQFDVTQRNLLPFRSVSSPGVNALASMLGITPDTSAIDAQIAELEASGADPQALAELQGMRASLGQGFDFQQSPGYQFRFNEGQDAVQNRLSAMGGRLGGRGLKELTRYGQDFASNEFGNQFNRLAGLTGVGQTATGQANQAGMAGTNAISDLITQQGNALAAGRMGQGNAIRGLIGSGIAAYGMRG